MSLLNDGTRYTLNLSAATVAQAASRQLPARWIMSIVSRWFWNQIFVVIRPPMQRVVPHLMRKRGVVQLAIAAALTPPPVLQQSGSLLY